VDVVKVDMGKKSGRGLRSYVLRLLPLTVVAAATLVAVTAGPVQAEVERGIAPAAPCADKPRIYLPRNADGFVDQGTQYTLTALVLPYSRITLFFEIFGTGQELDRVVTPPADANGWLVYTDKLPFLPAGTHVLIHTRYVCASTGQIKGHTVDTFIMQPPPDPCEIDPRLCDPCWPDLCHRPRPVS